MAKFTPTAEDKKRMEDEIKKSKKPPIVTKKQLEDSGFNNLRDYLNAKQGLTRRKDKAKPVKQQVIKPKITKDRRSDEPNYTNKRADADNMVPSKSTRSAKSRVKGAKNLVTEKKKNKGVFGFKRGGHIDGIAKRGKTKGTII